MSRVMRHDVMSEMICDPFETIMEILGRRMTMHGHGLKYDMNAFMDDAQLQVIPLISVDYLFFMDWPTLKGALTIGSKREHGEQTFSSVFHSITSRSSVVLQP